LRHARIENWSRANSPIHRRHAAAKILAALALLFSIATLHSSAAAYAGHLVLILLAIIVARLPILALLRTAAAVLPFALCFALITALAQDWEMAAQLVLRSYLSALTAVLLIATTPMPRLIAGLEWLRAPRFLTQVMQFLYRYLIVLMEEAADMTRAGASRAGTLRTLRFRQAAGAASVLFARSYARAEAIHRAMLARGFEGRMPAFTVVRFTRADTEFATGAIALAIVVRALG
jgi:cobalt/nickel transport system permease protein